MHCSRRLIVQTLVFSRSYLHRQVSPPETLVVKGGTTWARNGRLILPENARLPRNIQGSFTCRKSTTNGFSSLAKEGVLRIFSPWKIRRLRPGLNPWTWVPKASMLPLDHRSRFVIYTSGDRWLRWEDGRAYRPDGGMIKRVQNRRKTWREESIWKA